FVLAGLFVAGVAIWGTLDLHSQRQDHRNTGSIEAHHEQQKTAANIQNECAPLDPQAANICINEHLAAQEESRLQNEDHRAQKEMALASFWLWVLGAIQAG